MLDWRKAASGVEGSFWWNRTAPAAATSASTAASSSTVGSLSISTVVAAGPGAAAVSEQDLSVLRVVAVEVLGALTMEGAHASQVWRGILGVDWAEAKGGDTMWRLGYVRL